MIAPFGIPVLPEVKTTYSIAEGWTVGNGLSKDELSCARRILSTITNDVSPSVSRVASIALADEESSSLGSTC